ncbi:MAG: class I SAM-dependent methyltransferase [Bauldia sp.]
MKVRESGMPPEDLWITFFDPPEILSRLMFDGVGDAVELGCGYGTFTVEAGRRAGGTVYAFDIEPDMIAATMTKVRQAGLRNVVALQRDFLDEGTGLPPASTDYVFLFNILHATNPLSLVQEAFRLLRPGGRAGVIHWNPTGTPRGPDPSIRPRPDQCRAWLEQAGFAIALPPTNLPPYHFGLVGEKRHDRPGERRLRPPFG